MNYTKLKSTTASFDQMMRRFGVVTVMNAKVYEPIEGMEGKTAEEILEALKAKTAICTLDTLKTANVTVDGPDKTISGGQYSNPLIKFGKSARLEIQDALGNAAALDALCGGLVQTSLENKGGVINGLHFGEDFESPKTIVGDSFFIDQKSGQQVPVKIIFFQFLPDSLFNLTQDADGDASVFDMNGDLLTTNIKVPNNEGTGVVHGVFYSILPADSTSVFTEKTIKVFADDEAVKKAYASLVVGEKIQVGEEEKTIKTISKEGTEVTITYEA